jgi:hypothetical protein
MIYTIEKQGAQWLLKSAPSENDAPARLGAYKTRTAAVTVARYIASRYDRIIIMKGK